MKQLHKNKWFLIGLILVTFFSSTGSSLIVVAETLESQAIESKSNNDTTTESTTMNVLESTEPSVVEAEVDGSNEKSRSESSEQNTSSVIPTHSFPPPSVGDIGYLLLHNSSNNDRARAAIKYDFYPELMSNKFTVSNKLGTTVGDSTVIEIGETVRMHNWFMLFGTPEAESWYGDITFSNIKINTGSDSISAKLEGINNGSYKIRIERVKFDDSQNYTVELNYDYNFSYYKSNMVYNNWYSWQDAGTEKISNVTTKVPIAVEPVEMGITADPVPQNVVLGKSLPLGDGQRKKVVKNVKFNGREISENEYEVKYKSGTEITTIGNQEAEIEVIYSKDKTKTATLSLPITVDWGNTLHFKSNQGKSILGISGIYTGYIGEGMFYPTKGERVNTGQINPLEPNDIYISGDLYGKGITSFPYSNSSESFKIYGKDEITEAYKFDSFFKWTVGQVFKMYHKDVLENPELLELYTDSTKELPNSNSNMINPELYFLVDYYGELKPLYINQLKPNESKIPIDSDDAYLDSHINDFIDSRNYSNINLSFSQYPATKNAGKQLGKIKAKQDGISYEYEVLFDVVDNRNITADAVSQELVLGSKWEDVNPYNLVDNVQFGSQELDKEEYSVEITEKPALDTVGDRKAKVLITYKKDTSKTLTLDVPVNILWGNTIGSNGAVYQNATALSLSLLTKERPEIVATNGNGRNNGSWINDYSTGTYITAELYKADQLLNSGSSYEKVNISGRDNLIQAKNKWNSMEGLDQIEYGDVIHHYVNRGVKPYIDNKWVMRNESQSFESEEKSDIYYEITKNGYRTLHLNHLETKNVTIPIYSTEEYLDKNIKDYIDLKGYSNISVKEFSHYPNTKASGQQKGKIIVEETLTTGKKVQYEYEVTFNIGDGTLEYSVPKTLTFKEFTKSKSEQTIQRMYSGDLGLKISDNRGQGKQGNWRLTAQVKQSEELSPYLIFRDGTSQDKYLNQGAVEIYSQAKQSNPTEPLNVEVSGQWTKDTGILLKVPPKNNLSSKQYTSTITWNLVEGP